MYTLLITASLSPPLSDSICLSACLTLFVSLSVCLSVSASRDGMYNCIWTLVSISKKTFQQAQSTLATQSVSISLKKISLLRCWCCCCCCCTGNDLVLSTAIMAHSTKLYGQVRDKMRRKREAGRPPNSIWHCGDDSLWDSNSNEVSVEG